MFQLFLKKKLSQSFSTSRAKKEDDFGLKKRNRRVSERFKIDHKHLTMMNAQDILLVREISLNGFSTYVASSSTKRFKVGDVYSARIRYLGELHDLEARVTWIGRDVVGFAIVNATMMTMEFMKRLIYPQAIAVSLREVNAKFMSESGSGKTWYHGDEETDLFLWHEQSGELNAWQLVTKSNFVEWSEKTGLQTGKVKLSNADVSSLMNVSVTETERIVDERIDPKTRQLATDVFMALDIPDGPKLVRTLGG